MAVQPRRSCAIYLRISDDREGRELGVSRQEEDCRALAGRLGCAVYAVYKDNDISASTRTRKERPDYQRLLADARAGVIDTIIAYTSSRLTRRPREHEDLIELAEQSGIRFTYVASPSFDLNTAAGRRIARMLAANDVGEAEEIAERVQRAKLAGAAKGQYMGGARAYGFAGPVRENGVVLNRGQVNVAVIQAEKKIWLECVFRIIAGEQEMALVRDLNARGIPSPGGARWRVGNLKNVLTRRRYVIFDAASHPSGCPCMQNPDGNGTLAYHDAEHRAVWPGFITPEVHRQLIAAFQENSQSWAHGMAKGRSYLLTGFLVCGRCGSVMIGRRRLRADGTYQRRYACASRDAHGEPLGCGKVFRDAVALDDFVTTAVFERLGSAEGVIALIPPSHKGRALELGQQLTRHKAHRQRIIEEYGRGEHRKADYQVMLAAADDAIKAAEAELAALRSARIASEIPPATVLREEWGTISISRRRHIIRLVLEHVTVHPTKSGGGPVWRGYRFDPADVSIQWRASASGLTVLLAGWHRLDVRQVSGAAALCLQWRCSGGGSRHSRSASWERDNLARPAGHIRASAVHHSQ